MNYTCRTCLSSDNNEMESIYSIKCINNENISFAEMIALCAGLEISKHDNFTNFICKSCTDILLTAFNYRRKCWDSHKSLLQVGQQKRVLEEDDDLIEIIDCTEREVIICEDSSDNESVLDKPAVSEELDAEKPATVNGMLNGLGFHCGRCNHMFKGQNKMIEHLTLFHGINISIISGYYSCDVCLKSFDEPGKLKKHKKDIHCVTFDYNHKQFQCKFCDYRSRYHGRLCSHQKQFHAAEVAHLCELCGKNFISQSTLSQHMILIHFETRFKCKVCKKQFRTQTQFTKHVLIHDKSKEHACDVCGKIYSERSKLLLHVKQHTGEKSYTCQDCGRGFIQRSNWRTHMRKQHNETYVKMNI